jgi:YD repeat-containing protein
MTRNLLRAGALSCALLTSTAMCTQPALAQTASQKTNIPADEFAINPHGVDMRSGRYVYSHTDLQIGGEEGGLSLVRTIPNSVLHHINPFGNFSHNQVMMISERRVLYVTGGPGNDFRMTVHLGGLADTFEARTTDTGFTRLSNGPTTRLTWTGDRASGSVVYTYTAADGTVAVFRPLGTAGDSQCAEYLRCAFVSQVTQPDGTRLDFDYVHDSWPSGNRARLRRVVSSRGYALLIEGGTNFVTKACALNLAHATLPADGLCPAGVPTATYAYDSMYANGRLTSVTDPANATWSFTYGDGTMGFVRPGETTPWLTNALGTFHDEEGVPVQHVGGQLFATGETYTYIWDTKPTGNGSSFTVHGGSYTDAAGGETVYRYAFPIVPGTGPEDACMQFPCSVDEPIEPGNPGRAQYQVTPGPVEIRDPLGRTTTMEYCHQQALVTLPSTYANRCYVERNVVHITDPEGIRTWPTYDGNNNLTQARRVTKPGSTLPDIVISATYNTLNPVVAAKPASTTDARGNVTEYSYDPVHGGLLSETLPAPSPGAPRPQTRHQYAQRHAWVSNGAGGYVQSAQPMWVRTATSVCRTSAATGVAANPCATAGDEVRTTYDYGPDAGPNNLQLRGTAVHADGQVRRSCTGYDSQGRAISATSAGAGLSQCQ